MVCVCVLPHPPFIRLRRAFHRLPGGHGPERSDTLGEVRLIEGRLATAAKLTAAAYQSDADAAAADAAAVAVGDKKWEVTKRKRTRGEPIYNELGGQPVRASVL